MNTLYMHCPKCGADVPPHVNCGACGAFAMSKKLYAHLNKIAIEAEDQGKLWDNAAESARARKFLAKSKTDVLCRLGFLVADKSLFGYQVTGRGTSVLARMARP